MQIAFLPPHSVQAFTQRLRSFALFLIAASAIQTGANAQIDARSLTTGHQQSASVVATEQVRTELVAFAPQGVGSGKTVFAGLQIAHQPHWHTYWKNPGDSGLPTQLQWTLPAGISAGEILWPTPQKVTIGSLANYGFEGTVLLAVPLTIAPGFVAPASGSIEIGLTASWLVCRQECIPQDGSYTLTVPVLGSTALHAAAFESAQARKPKALAGNAVARFDGNTLLLSINGLPEAWRGKALNVFPETPEIVETSSSPSDKDRLGASGPGAQTWQDGVWNGAFALSGQRSASPSQLPLLLASGTDSVTVTAAVNGPWPPVSSGTAGVSPNASLSAAPNAAPEGSSSWLIAVLAAVLGGMILNLMPCVFPVLAIKVLSFAGHSGQDPSSQRMQGLAYTAGVVLSFMALGGLMLALRASGEQLGWGFQLQSPAVIAGLAVLFTLIGLNLAGLLEIGSVLPSSLASMQLRHPVGDAFLSGVLAVAIASPCTAPFMGASLGYAITLPAAHALGIFAALGVGLALPFLVAAWLPAVARWMPRPGVWMDTLRRFMAFPMWATVIWLLWVLGHLTGVNGATSLLALLLGLSLLVWSLGLEGRSRTTLAIVSIAVCAGLAGTIGHNVLDIDDSQTTTTPSTAGAVNWQQWAPGRVESELAQGHAVFVDFTAAWCITCQYNKKTTLANTEVLADFQAKNVTLLRADWTRRDPAITRALEQLGRTGVPVYAIYKAGQPAVVLSEVLGVAELRAALAPL
jgi:thiol:disulfide interchange protein/DsbC/DsbD-like thiol-disulfide interchange protein